MIFLPWKIIIVAPTPFPSHPLQLKRSGVSLLEFKKIKDFNFVKIKHLTGSTLRSGSRTLIPDIVRIEPSSPMTGETAKP